MKNGLNVEDIVLNYDPEFAQQRFIAAGLEGALRNSTGRLPSTVPWPNDSTPLAVPLDPPPSEADDLTRFRGFDAVVVTWTAAEAAALAALLRPDYLPSRWYEYRHNVAANIPLVTGNQSPFNDRSTDMARFYHSLGLYFPCRIGAARVLLFKSGLHLDYDGPAVPVRKLMVEITQAIGPKLFVTTGTGGGIGADVALGDVVVAGRTRFDCVTQFKNKTWHNCSHTTSPLPNGAIEAITPDLTRVNAARIRGARSIPRIWAAADDTVVTTDFFGFDDSTDYYHLQGSAARACDMGDATVADAVHDIPNAKWYSIRNASDLQMPNPSKNIGATKQEAAEIQCEIRRFHHSGQRDCYVGHHRRCM